MLSFKQIPDLMGCQLSKAVARMLVALTYKAGKVPDIDSASPGHFEDDFRRSVYVRLDERPRLLRFAYPCLTEVA